MTIKAIIFDLGGVLLRTADFTTREQLAIRLGMTRKELEELVFGHESGDRAQRGEITVREHWNNLSQQLTYTPEELKSLLDDFFAHDQLDLSLLAYVRKLHQSYQTALLSNAWDDLRQVIAEKWHFEDAFDEMIISAEVGLAKPDPQIYNLAIKRLGVKPGEAVFIDDMERNVIAAKSAGLQAIWFKSPQQMQSELEQLLDGSGG